MDHRQAPMSQPIAKDGRGRSVDGRPVWDCWDGSRFGGVFAFVVILIGVRTVTVPLGEGGTPTHQLPTRPGTSPKYLTSLPHSLAFFTFTRLISCCVSPPDQPVVLRSQYGLPLPTHRHVQQLHTQRHNHNPPSLPIAHTHPSITSKGVQSPDYTSDPPTQPDVLEYLVQRHGGVNHCGEGDCWGVRRGCEEGLEAC